MHPSVLGVIGQQRKIPQNWVLFFEPSPAETGTGLRGDFFVKETGIEETLKGSEIKENHSSLLKEKSNSPQDLVF